MKHKPINAVAADKLLKKIEQTQIKNASKLLGVPLTLAFNRQVRQAARDNVRQFPIKNVVVDITHNKIPNLMIETFLISKVKEFALVNGYQVIPQTESGLLVVRW